MGWRNAPETARAAWLFRVPPNRLINLDVDIAAKLVDFAAVSGTDYNGDAVGPIDLRGKAVMLQAVTHDITVLRGDYTTGAIPDLVAGAGLTIKFGDKPEEFFIPKDDADALASKFTLCAAADNKALRVFYDAD